MHNIIILTLCRENDAELEPDVMELEMSIASCQMLVSGAFAKCMYNAKENYFGDSQEPNAMDANVTRRLEALLRKSVSAFHNLQSDNRFRPLEVSVTGTFTDTTAHLLFPSETSDSPCPRIFIKTIVLEVLKQYEETTFQVVINPVIVDISDPNPTDSYVDPMQNGQVLVSVVQIRGHSMLSDVDVPVGEETVEYAWLLDIQVGDVVVRATLPQVSDLTLF